MKRKTIKILYLIIALICIGALVALAMYLVIPRLNKSNQSTSSGKVYSAVVSVTDESSNPIDFADIQQKNSDVYAWIKIPGTQIDYPIVQSYTEDDDFYLNHNINKNSDINGAIYTEKLNSLDFSDPNTVIYGHNMLDGSMFQNLHLFRDKSFFNQNRYFYIYTPTHILKYEIVSAYKSDNKHILNTHDFSNTQVFADYIETVKNPKSLIVNKRDVKITTNDKLVTLSTCIGNESDYRYLVQGVLVNDIAAK